MPEADAAWFTQQLVCAIEFCHRMGVANRDIKVTFLLLLKTPLPFRNTNFASFHCPVSRRIGLASQDVKMFVCWSCLLRILFHFSPSALVKGLALCAAAGQHAVARTWRAAHPEDLRLRLLQGRAGAERLQVHLRHPRIHGARGAKETYIKTYFWTRRCIWTPGIASAASEMLHRHVIILMHLDVQLRPPPCAVTAPRPPAEAVDDLPTSSPRSKA